MTVAEVVIPESPEAAVAAFGDGSGVTVVGGGTIVMGLMSYGWLRPAKALMLSKAGLSYINENGAAVTVGAMTPVDQLVGMPTPVGPCAAGVGDAEIRGQGTVGGNLCAPAPPEHPTGDLQAALIAVGASVRSVGAGGETRGAVEDFLSHRESRLVLDVTFERPAAGAYAALARPHTHHPTSLAVAGARLADGTVRLAVTGAGPTAVRLTSAEAEADDPAAAGEAALGDVELADDAVASAWYRERMLPRLVQRVLNEIKEAS